MSQKLVVATGGPSFPQVGATDFGYKIAKQFGHKIIPVTPALVPLEFKDIPFGEIAGVSLPVRIKCNGQSFEDDLLFTHKGLSGPAVLKISLYWTSGDSISINFLPNLNQGQIKFSPEKNKLLDYIGQICLRGLSSFILGIIQKLLVKTYQNWKG